MHVLVVDDDDFLLSAMKKRLELSGHKVTTSNNVHDAFFKLGMKKPDLIILDIIMPDINGIEFMSLINAQFAGSGIKVMLMSCLTKKHVSEMGYNIGDTLYLTKPFNVDKLPSIVENLA